MKISILGAAGFIGTNLVMSLISDKSNDILAVDESLDYFDDCVKESNVHLCECKFLGTTNFKTYLKGQDVVYHLISTNNPTYSNHDIGKDIVDNIMISINILEACVCNDIKKVIFISSGGTVYGDKVTCPISEDAITNPINTYGIQKLTIEKLFYLYNHIYGLDYSIVRLANPYGPHQRPNGKQGVISTFTYKALKNESLTVYGDGSVIRDYIYIEDAVNGIVKIANSCNNKKVFNLGSGTGVSINQIIEILKKIIGKNIPVNYIESRSVDVPVNVLDVTRYKELFDITGFRTLEEGIGLTMDYFKSLEKINDA
jgi:UDP-glucose 4-epimerase